MEATTRSTPIDNLALPPVSSMNNTQLVDALHHADTLEKQLAAWKLTLIGEADARGIAKTAGAANTAQWVAGILRIPPGQAGGTVKLARHVDRDLPATAAASSPATSRSPTRRSSRPRCGGSPPRPRRR